MFVIKTLFVLWLLNLLTIVGLGLAVYLMHKRHKRTKAQLDHALEELHQSQGREGKLREVLGEFK